MSAAYHTLNGGDAEYVCCVLHTRVDLKWRTWCGRTAVAFEFAFLNVDHAANTRLAEDRLLVCRACSEAIAEAMRK